MTCGVICDGVMIPPKLRFAIAGVLLPDITPPFNPLIPGIPIRGVIDGVPLYDDVAPSPMLATLVVAGKAGLPPGASGGFFVTFSPVEA